MGGLIQKLYFLLAYDIKQTNLDNKEINMNVGVKFALKPSATGNSIAFITVNTLMEVGASTTKRLFITDSEANFHRKRGEDCQILVSEERIVVPEGVKNLRLDELPGYLREKF